MYVMISLTIIHFQSLILNCVVGNLMLSAKGHVSNLKIKKQQQDNSIQGFFLF